MGTWKNAHKNGLSASAYRINLFVDSCQSSVGHENVEGFKFVAARQTKRKSGNCQWRWQCRYNLWELRFKVDVFRYIMFISFPRNAHLCCKFSWCWTVIHRIWFMRPFVPLKMIRGKLGSLDQFCPQRECIFRNSLVISNIRGNLFWRARMQVLQSEYSRFADSAWLQCWECIEGTKSISGMAFSKDKGNC